MLTLKTKNARFEWVDDDVESVVTLSSEDDEPTLVRKLKRIVALVEGGQAQATVPVVVGVDPAGDAVVVQTPANGWAAAYGPPPVPEHLQGEVELIQPGEDA
ncbi:hypothetical protein [Streptomyces cinereoruber]|uniref:hypothetical protein n=1 Tax=Streptomyces cinereoruber TaxID=67260 RepID=UPI003C2E82C9